MHCTNCGKKIDEARARWIKGQVGNRWPKCIDCGQSEPLEPEGYPTPRIIARMKWEAECHIIGGATATGSRVTSICNDADALVTEHLRRLKAGLT